MKRLQVPLILLFSSLLTVAVIYPLKQRMLRSQQPYATVNPPFELNPLGQIDPSVWNGYRLAGLVKDNGKQKPVLFEKSIGQYDLSNEELDVVGELVANQSLSRIIFLSRKGLTGESEMIVWEEGYPLSRPLDASFYGDWRLFLSASGREILLFPRSQEAKVKGPEFLNRPNVTAYSVQIYGRENPQKSRKQLPQNKLKLSVSALASIGNFDRASQITEEQLESFAWQAEYRRKSRLSLTRAKPEDLDGDRVSDFLLFGAGDQRPFWQAYSLAGFNGGSKKVAGRLGRRATWRLGNNAGVPLTGDFDGDGFSDIATYLPGHGVERESEVVNWEIFLSAGKRLMEQSREVLPAALYHWGMGDMLAVPEDYDGDGATDLALYQKTTGHWQLLYSRGAFNLFKGSKAQPGFGDLITFSPGGLPVPGDYNGDGYADLAVFHIRDDKAVWEIMFLSPGSRKVRSIQFGKDGDIPLPADFNCNGKTDLALYNPQSKSWKFRFGKNDIRELSWAPPVSGKLLPLTGDYDGDGCSDPAYFMPKKDEPGEWFVFPSSFAEEALVQMAPHGHNIIIKKSFGRPEDLPAQILLRRHQGFVF